MAARWYPIHQEISRHGGQPPHLHLVEQVSHGQPRQAALTGVFADSAGIPSLRTIGPRRDDRRPSSFRRGERIERNGMRGPAIASRGPPVYTVATPPAGRATR